MGVLPFQKNIYQKVLSLTVLLLAFGSLYAQKTVRYDLYVSDTMVNVTGKKAHALAINGQIPGPTLYFTEGDTAEIFVHNLMDHETSIHWHGLILPNEQDGVPYLTTAPIKPKSTHRYYFPIKQNGTYWYHSHTHLQEQSGLYGAFIIRKRNEKPMPEYVMLLSDWTDENLKQVNRSLHNATDWYAIEKGSTQDYVEALKKGYLKTKLTNEWKRMLPMDVADVYYDQFWINGKPEQIAPKYKAGDKLRLRIINGGASSYFWLQYAGGKIVVVANDGEEVEPVEVDRLIIAVSETYDVIVTIPDNMQYEFVVTPEDRTQYASLWLGSGMKMPAPKLPKLKYFEGMKMMNGMMNMDGSMDDMGMNMSNQVMDMNTVMYPEITGGDEMKDMKHGEMNHEMGQPQDIVTLNYGMLKATRKTTLPKNAPTKEMRFELTGNMSRYVWTIDNKTVSETDKILIKRGENIRIVIYNNSMMRHPMHLHGHYFRVLNGQGDYAPLKNVLDIMPMETDTIEFAATESGDWFFHCHVLYHMMAGMGRIFSYENSPPNPQLPNPEKAIRQLYKDDKAFYAMARIGLETNGSEGELMFANTRWEISTIWHLGLNDGRGYESETMVGRYIGKMQWLYPYIGFDYHYKEEGLVQKNFFDLKGSPKNIFGSEVKNMFGQKSNRNNRKAAVAGIAYTLPLLVIADARVDSDGKFRFQLSREDIPVTQRLRFNWMLNTDKEYMAGFRYIIGKYFSFSSHYDSDMGFGVGVTVTY